MNCDLLAHTGVSIYATVIVALVGVLAAVYVFRKSSSKVKIHWLLAWAVGCAMVVAQVGFAGHVSAAANCNPTTPGSTSHSGASGSDDAPAVQKLWTVDFNSDDDWNQFTRYNVSNDSPKVVTYNLTASSGTGTITADNPDNASNVRDFYVFNPAGNVKDGEVRGLVQVDGDFGVSVNQIGFIMRASNLGSGSHQAAVTAWTNVILWGSGATIAGVWHGNEEAGGTFDYDGGTSDVVSSPITSLVADGSQATVQFADDINVDDFINNSSYVNIVSVDPSLNGAQQITNMIDTHTLTFNTTATGTWTNTGSIAFNYLAKYWIAAKLVGNQFTIKHWMATQSEPAWNDPINVISYTLPATLGNGDPSPTTGKFGLVIGHADDGKSVGVSNLSFTSLD